jgi:signal transduction histidine kinase
LTAQPLAAEFPPAAVAGMAAELAAHACAAFDAADSLVWINSPGRALADAFGIEVFGSAADRRAAVAAGHGVRRRLELGPPEDRRHLALRVTRAEGPAPLALCAAADVTSEMRALGALRDMRRRSDELLSLISDCVWETDAEWRLTHFVLRDAGADKGRGCVGLSLFDVGAFEAPAPDGAGRRQRPITPRTRAIFREAAFLMPVGDRTRTFLLTGIPVFDERSGEFRGYRGSGDDVTTRRAAERSAAESRAALERTLSELAERNAELDAALADARAADAAKDEFLARMSHELRTPLNAVMGLSSILKFSVADRIDDKYVGYLDEIHRSGEHLLALVTEVLEFSRNRLAERALNPEPLDLGQVARESAAFLRLSAEKQGVALTVEAGDGLEMTGDRVRLRQVFINLVGNAVKFCDEGDRITVAVMREDGALRAEVRDTGAGIPPEKLEQVFEPFFQVQGGATRAHGGVGLGLAICRQLVRLHGGEIGIDSVEGEGTTVWTRFPVAGA